LLAPVTMMRLPFSLKSIGIPRGLLNSIERQVRLDN
jgi:hypothetical protein